MLLSVESTDRFDDSTLAVDCSDEEVTTIEASLYRVLHRTTAKEPLITVQQTPGQKGFAVWHAIGMRSGERNMSDNNSAHAAWIRNISERDRATDVVQINDILRTFICETTNLRADSAESYMKKRCSQTRN